MVRVIIIATFLVLATAFSVHSMRFVSKGDVVGQRMSVALGEPVELSDHELAEMMVAACRAIGRSPLQPTSLSQHFAKKWPEKVSRQEYHAAMTMLALQITAMSIQGQLYYEVPENRQPNRRQLVVPSTYLVHFWESNIQAILIDSGGDVICKWEPWKDARGFFQLDLDKPILNAPLVDVSKLTKHGNKLQVLSGDEQELIMEIPIAAYTPDADS